MIGTVMPNSFTPQNLQNSLLQPIYSANVQKKPRYVWQDKIANCRDRAATAQPAPSPEASRSHHGIVHSHRIQNQSTQQERTEPLTLHVRPIVKDRLKLIARREGLKTPGKKPLSISEVGGLYLDRGLQQHIDMQYGALLEPVIVRAVNQAVLPLRLQLRWLLVRVAFDANQTRSLVTNIFSRQPGISADARKNILIETAKAAKDNIFGKSPQLAELVRELDSRLVGERGAQHITA